MNDRARSAAFDDSMGEPEQLRDRMHRIDPVPGTTEGPATAPSSRTRLEEAMNTQITGPSNTRPTAGPGTAEPPAHRRSTWWLAAAAAVVVVVGAVAAFAGSDDGEGSVATGPPLELSLGESDVMASCMPVEARFLADMPVAFAGTAESVEGEVVTLTVDRWYTEGDAGRVVLRSAAGMEALIGGITFEPGQQYLVSATDGTVNFCGYSGSATPELTRIYEDAFGV